MTNKLNDNEQWKSKHAEGTLERCYDVNNYRRERPDVDPQKWEDIMRVLMESLGMRTAARFHLYDPYEECVVVGIVERVDPYTRTFTVESDRFKMADIIGATAL